MKTAKELMKNIKARDSWKSLKLRSWAHDYEEKATEWNNLFPPVKDDRRVYINTYRQVYEAIESLPENPPPFVCVAMNHELDTEEEMMNNILTRFS